MNKAEKFISDCTRNCSNELIAIESRAGKEVISYNEWLTPDQAEKDLELTWEDMRLIDKISSKLLLLKGDLDDKGFFQEVLKRFNEERKK